MDHPKKVDSPNQVNEHAWGHSVHLFHNKTCDLPIAHGNAGGASSLHFHRGKCNAFIVFDGQIELWDEEDVLIAAIGPGQSFVVPSMKQHRMVFITNASLYEFYIADEGTMLELGDIVRTAPDWEPESVVVKAKATSGPSLS